MGRRAIIRKGDTTSHGGKVLEGQPIFTIEGRELASVGHQVSCPRCKGIFEIGPDLLGRRTSHQVMGQDTAVEGMRTTCGAVLIASQFISTIEDDGQADDFTSAGAFAPGKSGSAPAETLLAGRQCRHPDDAIPIAAYIVAQMNENPFTDVGRKITANNSFDESKEAERWHASPWYLKLGGPPDFAAMHATNKAAAYALWAAKVAPDSDWDHKWQIQAKFLTNGKFHKWHKYQDFDYFYDIWSNIHYGYVGKAVGFTGDELLGGAGLAQFGDDARRDIVHGKLPSRQNHPSNGPWPKSADDIQDQTSIRLGIDLWLDMKPGALRVELLLERIAAVPVPWGDANEGAKRPHQCEHE